jgi:hypothetical protein
LPAFGIHEMSINADGSRGKGWIEEANFLY